MSTYTDIRYDYNLPSTAGGAIKLISEQTASASASISFTGIDSTYRTYMFKFINIHPSADNAKLSFQGSTDGGSNYGVTTTSTNFYSLHYENDSTTELTYDTSEDLAQSTSFIQLPTIGADNDQSACGIIHLFSPSNTTYVKHFIARTQMTHGADISIEKYIAGYMNTTSAINAIKFQMSSGNIDAGTIKMYGIA